MSVHAGSIVHFAGGQSLIDRVQSAGLGDVKIPTETVREVGNPHVVDKIVTEPDFNFSLESFDVSTEIEAILHGKESSGPGSAQAAGFSDPDGTEYRWEDCQFINIASPWKDPATGSAGTVNAGHLVPGYYVTRVQYRFGVTDNASQTVELSGGSYYYADAAPFEDTPSGTGSQTAFPTAHTAVGYRKGGALGTSFKRVFGVMVDGVLSIEGVDYTEAGPNDASAATATINFTVAPASGAKVKFCYFSKAAQSWPDSSHAAVSVKPAAVRGRHICVYVGSGRAKLGGTQTIELDATFDGAVERELCNENIIGRTVNGTDCNGTVVVRAKDKDAFLTILQQLTGVSKTEVIGWLNQNAIPLEIAILNPKDPSQTLKTLYVPDAIFAVPGTPAKVNTPTDFSMTFESQSGTYSAFKGAKP